MRENWLSERLATAHKRVCAGLRNAADSYMRLGLEQFHRVRREAYVNPQAALGLIAIAIELELKSYVARRAPHALYCGLPKELELQLAYPTSVAPDESSHEHAFDLEAAAHKTITFDEALKLACTLNAQIKAELFVLLKHAARVRNAAVHYYLPEMERHHVDRIAYAAFALLELVRAEPNISILDRPAHRRTADDEMFIGAFKEDRAERLLQKVEAAKKRAKTLSETTSVDVHSWDAHVLSCPVCLRDAVVLGRTMPYPGDDGLLFEPEELECEECGLRLEDDYELLSLGIPSTIDLEASPQEVGRWYRDHP